MLLGTLYLGLVLTPISLAHVQGLPRRKWPDELSSALALSAYAAILIEFVLSGRFRLVSGSIGIDATMRFHQLTARWLTVFILVHPFQHVTPLIGQALSWDTTRRLTLGLSGASLRCLVPTTRSMPGATHPTLAAFWLFLLGVWPFSRSSGFMH